jgi:hypothetical protein
VIPNPIQRRIQAFGDLLGGEQRIVFPPIFAGLIGFGFAAMIATEYRTKKESSCQKPCLRTARYALPALWDKFDSFIVVGAFVGRKETECGRDEVAHLLEGAGTRRAEERF